MNTIKPEVRAYFTDRRGAGVIKMVPTMAEAEKICRGAYGALEVEFKTPDGELIGTRERIRRGDREDGRRKWTWAFWKDAFDN